MADYKLKETNEEIRNIEAILGKLYKVRFYIKDMVDDHHKNGTVPKSTIILENELDLVDNKIFNFIEQKNKLTPVND